MCHVARSFSLTYTVVSEAGKKQTKRKTLCSLCFACAVMWLEHRPPVYFTLCLAALGTKLRAVSKSTLCICSLAETGPNIQGKKQTKNESMPFPGSDASAGSDCNSRWTGNTTTKASLWARLQQKARGKHAAPSETPAPDVAKARA